MIFEILYFKYKKCNLRAFFDVRFGDARSKLITNLQKVFLSINILGQKLEAILLCKKCILKKAILLLMSVKLRYFNLVVTKYQLNIIYY